MVTSPEELVRVSFNRCSNCNASSGLIGATVGRDSDPLFGRLQAMLAASKTENISSNRVSGIFIKFYPDSIWMNSDILGSIIA
jgi:hypothetical protein